MPQQSPFDSAFERTTPQAAQTSAPAPGGSPFDEAFGSPAATAPASTGAPSSNTGSPFDSAFESSRRPGLAAPRAESDPNAPWYSRAWDWANTPLWNLNPENKGGFVGGLEDVGSGLTSPLSIGLTLGTFGAGPALRALGLVGKEIPVALQGMRTLVEAGFTGQQIYGAIHESPRLLDALKYGDYESAKRIGVHVLANAGFGALGLRKTIPEAGALAERVGLIKPSEELAGVREEFGKYQLDVERAAHEADGLERAARRGLQEPGTLPDRQYAYRARDLGEQGIPSESHSQGTMSLDEARRYLTSRGRIQRTPQELVRVDLDRLASDDFQRMRGPNDADWVKFSKPIPESMVERAEGEDFAEPPAEKLNRKQRETLLGGITRFIEAGGDSELLARRKAALESSDAVKGNYSAKERRALLDKYEKAQNLTPEQQAFANRVRSSFEQDMELAHQHGIIRNAVENYVSHVWENDPTNASVNRTKFQAASRQFDTSLSAARARTFSTLFDGELLGKQAAVDDPVALVSRYRFDLKKAIAAREFLERLQDKDLRMPDGRAIVAASGRGQTIGDEGSPATLINPKAARSIRIAQPVIDAMQESGELDRHLDAGTIRQAGTKLVPIETGAALPQPLLQPRGWTDLASQPVNPQELADISRALGREVSAQELPEILRRQTAERNVAEGLQGNRRDVTGELREAYRTTLEKVGSQQTREAQPQMGEIVSQNGRRFRVEPTYAWEAGDYQAIDHSAFRDWNFATNAPDGSPIFVKSDLRVHPDAAEFVKRAIGADRSPIRDLKIGDVPVGRKFLKISSEGKHLLLSLSPFHLVQEGLRAVMTGINPLGKLDFDLNDPDLAFGVTHGLTLGGSRRTLADFTEGVASHSSIINRIPGLRTLQGEMQHFLFDRYIPGLKARAFKSLFDRYQKAYSDISPAEAAQLAAAHSNELFGGLNYGQMGRSMATQDFLRATTLAPDWLESEVRSLYRALDPRRGAVMRRDIMRMAAIMFGASRVLNYLTSGQPHLEAPFGVVVPGQQKGEADKVFTLRTLPTDMMHALTSPRDFIAGRVNPLSVRPAVEFLTGRDRQGRKVEFPQEVGDFFSAFTPIPATNIANKLQDVGNMSGAEVAARTLGASTYQYKTEAEKVALQLASDRMPSGPLTGEQLAAHRRKLNAEAMIRAGQEPDLTEFSAREKREIRKNAELSALQAHFQRLPMESALAVWDTATPQERAMLVPEFLKKKNSFMRAHNADTMSEKQSNRTYQRLLAMFAEGAPEITRPTTATTAPGMTPLPTKSPFDSAFQ